MALLEIIPNIIAMIFSLIATILLSILTSQTHNKALGQVIQLIVIGIYLSVTAHAAFELMGIFGWIEEEMLFLIMGSLLSAGSILFIIAGYIGISSKKNNTPDNEPIN